ncbi:MAG: Ig-like domain-containing protein [Deltaproteobacteria bacterium]|jgi:FtsP/CotA-like multicopper oxidase with cupredoxin domain|nr:Ig-like domain-containing protein [Deltaproteobacteria bacterium]
MKCKVFNKNLTILALALMALALTAGSSFAVDLVALKSEAIMPDGTPITMWGFALDTGQVCEPTTLPAWDVGPTLTDADLVAGSLTINLRNCLSEEVSIVIPGQAAVLNPVTFMDGQGRTRVKSFTTETPDDGTTVVPYTWTGLKPGTFLYQSGTHPAKQVQMGLYGSLIVLPATAGAAYDPSLTNPDTAFDTEVVLLYSEIDPALHDPVPATAQPINYKPQYFLVNGNPYENGDPALTAGNVSQNTLIRFLNAGLKTHVPTLLGAYMRVIAEDGNLYPYAREQYSVHLAAGKTMDAIWTPAAGGTYALYDRSLHLTTAGVTGGGMLVQLAVGTASGAPVAVDDSATVAEGGTVTVLDTTQTSVLFNDTGVNTLEAILVSNVSNGDLTTLSSDGTFSYTHDGGETATDSFTYKARDTVSLLESNVATVSITITPVNDPPVAVNDAYDAVAGNILTVAAPGVLGNDSDPDGDPLTASLDVYTGPGILTLNSDGSFSYTPASTAVPGDTDSFTYVANDSTVGSAAATVTITVIASPANQPPVAQDDFASTPANSTGVIINVLANDSDPDGILAPSTVTIVTKPTQKGKATANADGTITYVPKRNFRGTDVFTYTVEDDAGATSNEATVRVNVL